MERGGKGKKGKDKRKGGKDKRKEARSKGKRKIERVEKENKALPSTSPPSTEEDQETRTQKRRAAHLLDLVLQLEPSSSLSGMVALFDNTNRGRLAFGTREQINSALQAHGASAQSIVNASITHVLSDAKGAVTIATKVAAERSLPILSSSGLSDMFAKLVADLQPNLVGTENPCGLPEEAGVELEDEAEISPVASQTLEVSAWELVKSHHATDTSRLGIEGQSRFSANRSMHAGGVFDSAFSALEAALGMKKQEEDEEYEDEAECSLATEVKKCGELFEFDENDDEEVRADTSGHERKEGKGAADNRGKKRKKGEKKLVKKQGSNKEKKDFKKKKSKTEKPETKEKKSKQKKRADKTQSAQSVSGSKEMALTGKVFFFLGRFTTDRASMKRFVEGEGGQVASSLTRKVTHLLCADGDDGTLTFKQARLKRLKIITEERLRRFMRGKVAHKAEERSKEETGQAQQGKENCLPNRVRRDLMVKGVATPTRTGAALLRLGIEQNVVALTPCPIHTKRRMTMPAGDISPSWKVLYHMAEEQQQHKDEPKGTVHKTKRVAKRKKKPTAPNKEADTEALVS